MRQHEVWIQLQGLAQLFDSLIVLTCQDKVSLTHALIESEADQLLGSPYLGQCLAFSPESTDK